jgi:hypothetical protein
MGFSSPGTADRVDRPRSRANGARLSLSVRRAEIVPSDGIGLTIARIIPRQSATVPTSSRFRWSRTACSHSRRFASAALDDDFCTRSMTCGSGVSVHFHEERRSLLLIEAKDFVQTDPRFDDEAEFVGVRPFPEL